MIYEVIYHVEINAKSKKDMERKAEQIGTIFTQAIKKRVIPIGYQNKEEINDNQQKLVWNYDKNFKNRWEKSWGVLGYRQWLYILTTSCGHNPFAKSWQRQNKRVRKMNLMILSEIIEMYEKITIQTRQITVKDLDDSKISFIGSDGLRLTVNSKEDVFISIKDIRAVYGKNRRG